MSTLQVQTLQGPTSGADSNTVRVADGHNLHAKGHVIQMLFHEWEDSQSFNSDSAWGSVTDSSVVITPKFSGSKIFVECNIDLRCQATQNQAGGSVQIVESGGSSLQPVTDTYETYSSVTNGTSTDYRVRHAKKNECQTSVVAGTAKTFLCQVKSQNTNVTVTANSGGFYSTMTVWEIAQ